MLQVLETFEQSGKLWFKKTKQSEFDGNHFDLLKANFVSQQCFSTYTSTKIDRKHNVSSFKSGFPIASPKISLCFFSIVRDEDMKN